jgi:hypothetical protein
MDVGSENPIVARLHLGLLEIIQMAQIPDDRKDAIRAHCFELGKDLVLAEKSARPLMNELVEIENRLRTEGVRTQAAGRAVEIPGVLRLDDSRVFLKYAKQALQTLANALGVILKKDFQGPHFHLVRDHVIGRLGQDHIVSKLLVEDQGWIKEIIDLRNEDEHPRTGKAFIRGFDITRLPDGRWGIDPPRFFNDAPVLNRLQVYSHNLLTFSEETIAHSLENFFPPIVQVVDIPESERNSDSPRYRLGLKTAPQFAGINSPS